MNAFRKIPYNAGLLPFVPEPDTFIYLAPDGWADPVLEYRLEYIKKGFSYCGYKFIYLPDMIGKITPELISYNVPEYDGPMLRWQDVRDGFAESLGRPLDCAIVVMFGKDNAQVVVLDEPAGEHSPVETFLNENSLFALDNAYIEVKQRPKAESEKNRKPKARKEDTEHRWGKRIPLDLGKIFDDTVGGLYDQICPEEEPSKTSESEVRFRVAEPNPAKQPARRERPRTQAELNDEEIKLNELDCKQIINTNINDMLGVGISAEQIRQLLNLRKKKLSKIHITRSGRIYLEDYNNKEVKFKDDLSLAVYMLYLKHESGINLKFLQDYYDELLDYYQSVSGRDDNEAMARTVRNLFEPGNNQINVLISRIKKSFIEAIDEDIAQKYYISGKKGEARFITLDRSLVVWDAIRPPYNR